jgi:hypothetical protein
MSWQAFNWHEIVEQARDIPLGERIQPALGWTEIASQQVLRVASAFLSPFALAEALLGLWRLGADLGLLGAFFAETGVLSHWQVWMAMAIGTQFTSVWLNRRLRDQNHSARTAR